MHTKMRQFVILLACMGAALAVECDEGYVKGGENCFRQIDDYSPEDGPPPCNADETPVVNDLDLLDAAATALMGRYYWTDGTPSGGDGSDFIFMSTGETVMANCQGSEPLKFFSRIRQSCVSFYANGASPGFFFRARCPERCPVICMVTPAPPVPKCPPGAIETPEYPGKCFRNTVSAYNQTVAITLCGTGESTVDDVTVLDVIRNIPDFGLKFYWTDAAPSNNPNDEAEFGFIPFRKDFGNGDLIFKDDSDKPIKFTDAEKSCVEYKWPGGDLASTVRQAKCSAACPVLCESDHYTDVVIPVVPAGTYNVSELERLGFLDD